MNFQNHALFHGDNMSEMSNEYVVAKFLGERASRFSRRYKISRGRKSAATGNYAVSIASFNTIHECFRR